MSLLPGCWLPLLGKDATCGLRCQALPSAGWELGGVTQISHGEGQHVVLILHHHRLSLRGPGACGQGKKTGVFAFMRILLSPADTCCHHEKPAPEDPGEL